MYFNSTESDMDKEISLYYQSRQTPLSSNKRLHGFSVSVCLHVPCVTLIVFSMCYIALGIVTKMKDCD